MHTRLKRRITYYTLIFVTVVCVARILFSDRNPCPSISPHQVSTSDVFNLNDHHVELEVKEYIERSQRSTEEWGPHQLGVVIPYRTRFEEMKEFLPYMERYLNEKKIRHKIYIINQVDTHRFNRASLINVGFLIARNESCDYMAMHDVDLLPLNKDLNYGYPEFGPFHVAAPHLHPKYHYETFVGGILLVSMAQYETLNGMSNKFWGWGREDDEFYMRISDQGYEVFRHGGEITTGLDTFKHVHGRERKRDYVKMPGQKKSMFSRDRFTGFTNIKFKVQKRQELVIDGGHASVIDVVLHCDVEFTPWCDLPPPPAKPKKHKKPKEEI